MKPSSKEQELAELEARKQAILQGMGQGAEYPAMDDDPSGYIPGSSGDYAHHMRDASDDPRAREPRDHDGIMDMSDALPAYPEQRPARMASSAYPEQDSQSAEIAALQRRLKALQGF